MAFMDGHFAALSSYTGKLSGALEGLAKAPDDAVLRGEVMAYCGASLLVLASIAAAHEIFLDESIASGAHEIQGN